jgi:hypothetical protein
VSNIDPAPEAINLKPGIVQAVDVVEARKASIGDGAEVRRLLPQRTLRTIGAWCFLDHYGPDEISRGPGMQVPLTPRPWAELRHETGISARQDAMPLTYGVAAGQGRAWSG